MSNYKNNIWAQEMGINLDDLLRERPEHLEQLQNTRAIARRGAEYWARERFLAQVTFTGVDTAGVVPVVKKRGRRAKVRRYEFTETQLDIAARSLNAEGSV